MKKTLVAVAVAALSLGAFAQTAQTQTIQVQHHEEHHDRDRHDDRRGDRDGDHRGWHRDNHGNWVRDLAIGAGIGLLINGIEHNNEAAQQDQWRDREEWRHRYHRWDRGYYLDDNDQPYIEPTVTVSYEWDRYGRKIRVTRTQTCVESTLDAYDNAVCTRWEITTERRYVR